MVGADISHLTNTSRERIIWSTTSAQPGNFCPLLPPPLHTPVSAAVTKTGAHWRCYSTNSNIRIRQERHQHLLRPFLTHYETTQVHTTHMTKLSFMSQPWHQLFCKALNTDFYRIQLVAHRRSPTPQLQKCTHHSH